MNVRRILADRLGEEGIDEANDRCIIFIFNQVFRLGQSLRYCVEIHVIAQAFHRFHGLAGLILIGLLQQLIKLRVTNLTQFER